jgi:hypothetical protein
VGPRELKPGPQGKPVNAAKGLNSGLLSTISTAGGWRGRAKGAGQTLTLKFPNLPTGAARVEQEGGRSAAGLPAVCTHSVHSAGGSGRDVEELSFDGP